MKSIFFRSFSNQLLPYSFSVEEISNDPIQAFKEEVYNSWGIPIDQQTLFHNGRLIHNNYSLESFGLGSVIDISLSLKGGKGGFGSLLRGQAKSNKKITNFDASRDLQGRRIRNVKLQQKVLEWAKQKREEEKRIQKEVEEFTKAQKEIQGVQRDIRLTQEFKDKVEKWDNEMSSSIRAGAKKFKKLESKRENGDDSVLDDFAEPAKKKKVVTEELVKEVNNEKNNTEPLDGLDSKLSKKLAALLKDAGSHNNNNNTEPKLNGELEENKSNSVQTNNTENVKNGKQGMVEEKKEVKEFGQIDLKSINSMQDLIDLGPDHLKHELMRLGLKCGGSLQDRAKRLYDIKLKPELLFDPKYIAKK